MSDSLGRDDLLRFLKAIADESRLKILGLIAERELSVKQQAERLGLREPTVSHHLARLVTAGLVTMRPDGNQHFYRLNPAALQAVSKNLRNTDQVKSWADDVEADAFDRKVLATFLQGGRLVEIPAARKKRQVVLRWLADRFEIGRQYSHREVNDIIKTYHDDSATLRRELIASRLMHREGDRYWRLESAGD